MTQSIFSMQPRPGCYENLLVLSPETRLAWQQRLCLFAEHWQSDCQLIWLGEEDEMSWPLTIKHVHVVGHVQSAQAVCQILEKLVNPADLLVFPGTEWSLLQAGYYSAQSDTTLFENVITSEDEQVLQKVPGGHIRRTLCQPAVLTLTENINLKQLVMHKPSHSSLNTVVTETLKRQTNHKQVLRSLGIGRGVTRKQLDQLRQWARQHHWQINGSSGAIDQHKITADHLVGLSAQKPLKVSTYLALGISGSSYHLQGLDCQTLLAINQDRQARVFQHCRVGLVGSIDAWLTHLFL